MDRVTLISNCCVYCSFSNYITVLLQIQSFMCIVDDIMDGSEARRGKPCWYLLPDVGSGCATNDSLMLYNLAFYLFKKNFGDRSNYKEMLDAINEVSVYFLGSHPNMVLVTLSYDSI